MPLLVYLIALVIKASEDLLNMMKTQRSFGSSLRYRRVCFQKIIAETVIKSHITRELQTKRAKCF